MTLETTAATEAAFGIESIKELMDGFDPAALLPDLSTALGKVELVCRVAVLVGPILILALGIAYLLLSPKEANYYFGYRCYFGMGSVQAWRFSQRIAGLTFAGLGLVLTVIMLLISGGFSGMAAMDLAWKAVWCLVWEAALVLLATLAINGVCMFFFNAKGEPRRKSANSRRKA